MKIKTKTIKNPRQFPYEQYNAKIGNHKFQSCIYEDGGGQLLAYIKKEMVLGREDATLEDWLKEAEETSDFYHNLVDFLKEVRYARVTKK